MILSDLTLRWVMFLINPFVAMIFSFMEYIRPYAKNMFWAFCTFYGLTFAVGAESQGSDINRYVLELSVLYNRPNLTIPGIIEYFLSSGEIDILRTLISYILSRFTDSQSILTMVYGFIFGYFFSRNIWYVFSLLQNKIQPVTKLLLLTLILIMPIWQIGGFRMWTAFHIFIYGLLTFIIEKRNNTLIFLYLSFLVHFSFLIPISLFILYRLLGNRINLYFIIFVFSLLVSELNVSSLNTFIDNSLPDRLADRTSSYRIDSKVEDFRERVENSTLNWYVVWNTKLLSWGLTILLLYLFIYRYKLFKLDTTFKRLLSITLMMYSMANILMNVPSGARFLNIAFFLTLILVILYHDKFYRDWDFRNILILLTPVFLLFIIVAIRKGFYATSITSLFGNPLLAILSIGNNVPLNDLIK